MKRRITILFGLLLLASAAHADDAANKAGAQALFDEGRKLMDAGKYAEACPKLAASQKLDPGGGTLLNLAACYEKNGQTASAWVTYTDAAAASDAKHPDWAQKAREKARALEPSLAKMTITISNDVSGIVVTRDGVTIEPTTYGAELPVDPGKHTLEATAPGYHKWMLTVDVGVGSKQAIAVPPLDKDQAVAAEQTKGNGQRTVGLVLIGTGVAGLVVGSIGGIVAIDKRNTASRPEYCVDSLTRCNSAGAALISDAQTAATISTIGFVAGGVLAVGGLLLYFLAPHAEQKPAPVTVTFGAPGANVGAGIAGTF